MSAIAAFIQNPDLTKQLEEKNNYITFEQRESTVVWKVVKLCPLQVFFRTIFGWLGAYRNTHQTHVVAALKEALKPIIEFQGDTRSVKKIIKVAHSVLQLHDTGDTQSTSLSDVVHNKLAEEYGIPRLRKTMAFVEKNEALLAGLKNVGIGFKIRRQKHDRLSVFVNAQGVHILGRKVLGQGGYKKVKTVYHVDKKAPMARAIMTICNPKMNWLQRVMSQLFFEGRFAQNELRFLTEMRGDQSCIQLESNYISQDKARNHKLSMFMELADGSLFDLMLDEAVTQEQKLDIASQIINAVVGLSKRQIWHRDIKPLNFLYIQKEDRYEMRIADFGLAASDKNIVAQKFIGGTPAYIAPENFHYFRLTNGKAGDIYALGKTFADLFPIARRPGFVHMLIQEMMEPNPSNRPTAEELQAKFQNGLNEYRADV